MNSGLVKLRREAKFVFYRLQTRVWADYLAEIQRRSHVARAGLVAIVPSNARHSVKALTDGRAIIVDYPPRGAAAGESEKQGEHPHPLKDERMLPQELGRARGVRHPPLPQQTRNGPSVHIAKRVPPA